MELVVSFEKDDKELIAILQEQFGNVVSYDESKNFDGLEILLTAAIPITSLTVQIIDFVLANFWNRKSNDNRKRIIVEPDGNIELSGYTEEEARRIIECYFENQHDKRE